MAVLRISTPGKPTTLVDLGPQTAQRHPYHAMRKTVDDLRASAGVGRGHGGTPSIELHR